MFLLKVLVTGGAGFIGSYTVDQLIERGYEVEIFDNLEPQVHKTYPNYLNKEAKFIKGDVTNSEDWKRCLKDRKPRIILMQRWRR